MTGKFCMQVQEKGRPFGRAGPGTVGKGPHALFNAGAAPVSWRSSG